MPALQSTGELYVYGVTRASVELPALDGIDGQPVRTELLGELAAVVSDLPDAAEFGRPEDIRAHTTVLDTIAAHLPVLPMTFATIVPDAAAIGEIGDPMRQQEYLTALDHVAGAVQFTVRARYVEETVLGELVAEHPEVGRLRDATAGRPTGETYYERIRLGELVVEGMGHKGAEDSAMILDVLRPFVRDVRTRDTGQAEDVLEAAVLVAREDQQAFEDALEDLAATMPDRVTFRLVGPQAPYDFVQEP